jgi:2-polyprenyl-3-methyl-5-hydroxy-6-metoxy-1,4-benzoquinol methylase
MFDLAADYYEFDDINHTVVAIMAQLRRDRPGTPKVLDVGCGRGQLGGAIHDLGYRVTGIERNPEAAARAGGRLDEVVPIDLADPAVAEAALADRRFDVILFADVLEHLPDPLAVLRFYLRFLAPGGRVIISLPNIACWDRRLALMLGRFDYADAGIMDRTHLRFFTFRTAGILVREAGLTVLSTSHAPGIARAFLPLIKRGLNRTAGAAPDPGAILNSSAYRFYEAWLLPAERWIAGLSRGLLSFRIVIVAAPDGRQ